jgi:hypothetical protein
MIRTLLATFLTMWLPLLLIAAGILLVVKSYSERGGANAKFYTGALLLSVPLRLVAYIASGMIAAALRGGGHFYSVPFGGYTASPPWQPAPCYGLGWSSFACSRLSVRGAEPTEDASDRVSRT